MIRSARLVVVAALVATTTLAGTASATAAVRAESSAPPVQVIPLADAPDGAARARVAAMDLRQKAASVVMGHIPTTDPAEASDYLRRTGIGGFLLMGANIPADEAALRGLTAALHGDDASFPPLLAVDQEGGDVSRLHGDGFGSALTLKGAAPAEVEAAFAARAALVARAGIDVNFGIVADVTADPGMFIFRRALGTTPDAAAASVAAAVAGESDTAASTLKHFPGHGTAPGDSHAGIPQTDESLDAWRAADAVPFAAGIDAGAPLLMYGHLRFTAVDAAPASLSAEWHRIARDDLGFDGVAITDDLGMLQASGEPQYADPVANAVAALVAGNDMVLTVVASTAETAPRTVDGIVAAVENGTLSVERLDEAATRVAQLRLERAAATTLMPCAECTPVG